MKMMLPLSCLILALAIVPSALAEDMVSDHAYIIEDEDRLESLLNSFLDDENVAIYLETREDADITGDLRSFAEQRFSELELDAKYNPYYNLFMLFVLNTTTAGENYDSYRTNHLKVISFKHTRLSESDVEALLSDAEESWIDYSEDIWQSPYIYYDRWFEGVIEDFQQQIDFEKSLDSDTPGDTPGGSEGSGSDDQGSGDSENDGLEAFYCEQGGSNKANPCRMNHYMRSGRWVLEGFESIPDSIAICDYGQVMETHIREWVLSDPALKRQVLQPIEKRFDNAVKRIFNKLMDEYSGTTQGATYTCNEMSSVELLEDPGKSGAVCNHWSSLLLSLIRSMGVPESRVFIADYGKGPGTEYSGHGHAVVLYESDSGAWWVLDLTCCNRIVTQTSTWDGLCSANCLPVCTIALVNDHTPSYSWNWRDSVRVGGFLSDKEYCYA